MNGGNHKKDLTIAAVALDFGMEWIKMDRLLTADSSGGVFPVTITNIIILHLITPEPFGL